MRQGFVDFWLLCSPDNGWRYVCGAALAMVLWMLAGRLGADVVIALFTS